MLSFPLTLHLLDELGGMRKRQSARKFERICLKMGVDPGGGGGEWVFIRRPSLPSNIDLEVQETLWRLVGLRCDGFVFDFQFRVVRVLELFLSLALTSIDLSADEHQVELGFEML